MTKGFTLIETIIYVALLSVILTGTFSSLFGFLRSQLTTPAISVGDYELLISNFHE
jgi:prepilin-type N-terminal cleavage/methylation domain-containing protein